MVNFRLLCMGNQKIKKKLILLGELNSINIELIIKSFLYLKNKVDYLILCNLKEFKKDILFNKSKIEINEIYDPIKFKNYKRYKLNVFNIEDISKQKYVNLLNQIRVSNNIANITKYDLVTMPINKAIFKKKIKFTGMTEYLGALNKRYTIMLMVGEKFSIIPYTTHINVKNIKDYIKTDKLNFFLKNIFINLNKKIYEMTFKNIFFLCYNPHCGEDGTLGKEDVLIKDVLKKHKRVKGFISADSAFNKLNKNSLFISTYHDQALIPFKILNKKSLNLTIGLNYRRLSPAHGTANDIRNKNQANNGSYLT